MRSIRLIIALTLSLAAGALVAAAPTLAAAPAPKPCPTKKATKKAAKRSAAKGCVVPQPAPKLFRQTLVTATLLPGSFARVEIPALPLPGGQTILGTGVTRDIPMSGSISGALTYRFKIGQDIDVSFDKADFRLAPVDILTDPACNNAPTLRINPASVVVLDNTKKSSAVLRYSGFSQASASVTLRLAFDMRTEAGCDKPLVTTGYAETPFTDNLSGKVGPRGLVELPFVGDATTASIGVCLYPGAPDQPCTGGAASYPVKVVVYATVKISLKAGKLVPLELKKTVVPKKVPAPKKPA